MSANSNFVPRELPTFLTSVFCYCCIVTLFTLPQNPQFVASLAVVTKPESTTRTTNEQYPVVSTTTQTSSSILLATNTSFLQAQQQQPKSLKFTLIAGKFWKFNIKANSLTAHKEEELRLHKNVSTNNYIIDDEGWFQYNAQQQQLLAWPSLATKPGTYHFVLVPSGVDFEADSENSISPEIAAILIVELIRPLYQGTRSEIDQYLDHKFSLDYLHRHSSYTLLLNQIVSVLDTIAKFINSTAHNSPYQQANSYLIQQQKYPKLTNKFNEILLISSTYSSDGEYFSLTWSTHPSLVNNTLMPINECRLSTINDTILKLSSTPSGSYIDTEKYTIYFPLDAPVSNSQAILPTERGNNALRLTLNGPCRRVNILEELGLARTTRQTDIIPDSNDKENNVVFVNNGTSSGNITLSTLPGLPYPEAIDSTRTATSPVSQTKFHSTKPDTSTTILTTESNDDFHNLPNSTTDTSIIVTAVILNQTTQEPQVSKTEEPSTFNKKQAKSFANFFETLEPTLTSTTMSNTSLEEDLKISGVSKTPYLHNTTTTASTDPTITVAPAKVANYTIETSLNEDFIGILNDVMEYLVSIAVPASIIIGLILLISILIASCSLCMKKRKSKQFQVRNRFDFRYGSERKAFLKNSSKPVILDADQKSLSMGGTPRHKPTKRQIRPDEQLAMYLPMSSLGSETGGIVLAGETSTVCDGGETSNPCDGGGAEH